MAAKDTVCITGASSGIGLALTEYYLSQGATVIAACRTQSEALAQMAHNSLCTIIERVDVTSDEALKTFSERLQHTKITILINNAGVLKSERLESLDFDSVEMQFRVNAMGPLKVYKALESHLSDGAKIALITSRMGSIADNGSGGSYAYRMSKAALNAAGKSLAIDLKEKGLSVAIVHPGFVQTRMVGFAGDVSSEQSAQNIAARIDALTLENSGTFWHAKGDVLPW